MGKWVNCFYPKYVLFFCLKFDSLIIEIYLLFGFYYLRFYEVNKNRKYDTSTYTSIEL